MNSEPQALASGSIRDQVGSAELEPIRQIRLADSNTAYLWILLAIALFLRVLIFHVLPSIYFADEIFQSQEAAHRLVYGIGVITWEFRLGARSWVLPGLVAGIMKATAWLAPGSAGYVFGVALFFSLLSLVVIWFAFSWCRQYVGAEYAFLAAFCTTVWYELIELSPRVLNEFIAANLLLPAIYLGSLTPERRVENKLRLFFVGALLGLAVCLRMQFGPVVLLSGLWILSRNWRSRFLPIALGVLVVLLVFGATDAITWGYPFHSYYANFRENIVHHRAAGFGVLPWYYPLSALVLHTGPLAIFALVGVRRSPILGWISLAVIIPHLFIAHKEFRFLYPVLPILLTLASIGLIDTFRFIEGKFHWNLSAKANLLVASCFILACSLGLASQFRRWHKDSGGLQMFGRLSRDQQACGLALIKIKWWETGGYTYLHRRIPVFQFSDRQEADSAARAFNRIAAPQSADAPLSDYSQVGCKNGVCLYRRDGSCEQQVGSEFEINEYLRRRDE
jgi:hypothetical protein